MAFEGPVDERLAIRERLDAYADAVIRRDFEAWIACWDDEASWVIRGETIVGRARIGTAWLAAMARYAFVGFHTFPASVAVAGDTAVSQAHTLEVLVPHQGPERRQHGFYRDRLTRRGGIWRFRERVFEILHPLPDPRPRSPS